MREYLPQALWWIGWLQLSVLIASALVPLHLRWQENLAKLPLLLRQLFWVYGGYTVLAIVGLGLMCLVNAEELAAGSLLARSCCCFGALFWGVRLALQVVLNAPPHLTNGWLWAGEVILTLWFATFTVTYLASAFA